jgi:hypothetical protein
VISGAADPPIIAENVEVFIYILHICQLRIAFHMETNAIRIINAVAKLHA